MFRHEVKMIEKLLNLACMGLVIGIIDRFTPLKQWFRSLFLKNRSIKKIYIVMYLVMVAFMIVFNFNILFIIGIGWLTVYLWFPVKS